MKKKYINQVQKRLHLPHKEKAEVLRDLNEIFDSALEHGETEQQVIERLGAPKDFADNAAEQFGIGNAVPPKRKGIVASVAALIIAAASFAIYAVIKAGEAPKGAIGQASAVTNIHIEDAFGFNALQIILAVGIVAAVFAVFQIIQTTHKGRR